jgi:hypothetical protein
VAVDDGVVVGTPVVAELVTLGKIPFPHPELGNTRKMNEVTVSRGNKRIQRLVGPMRRDKFPRSWSAGEVCALFTWFSR